MSRHLYLLEVELEHIGSLPASRYIPIYARNEDDARRIAQEWEKENGQQVSCIEEKPCGYTMYRAHYPGKIEEPGE